MAPNPYSDPDYRAAVAWLKRNPATPCWKHCGRPATTIDHDPPLRLHHHTRGAHCCALRPCCAPCNYGDGASMGNRLREPHTERWW